MANDTTRTNDPTRVNDPTRTNRPVTPATNADTVDRKGKDLNPDPITGAPGSHPVGTGIGAAAAGAAGAAIGSVIPGAGTVMGGAIGAVVGALAGGLAGKGIAEAVDPTAEEAFWREEYRNRPYYREGYDFDNDYAPAYLYGYDVRWRNPQRGYDQYTDEELRDGWDRVKDKSRLTYDEARLAMRDAWSRWDERQNAPRRNG